MIVPQCLISTIVVWYPRMVNPVLGRTGQMSVLGKVSETKDKKKLMKPKVNVKERQAMETDYQGQQ